MDPPEKPDETDCCNSGCTPCILDVYEQQLKKYKDTLLLKEKLPDTFANCMKLTAYATFTLKKVTSHSLSTSLLTFEYLKPTRQLFQGDATLTEPAHSMRVLYCPGQHFLLKAASRDGTDVFTRAYTPIPTSTDSDLQFTILVRFYEQGKMSNYLKRLKVGARTDWRGPYGDYLLSYDHKRLLCIVQGTGVAPIYAIANKLIENEDCVTFIHVFCCYRSASEILLRDELYQLASNWNFTYEIFLSDVSGLVERFSEKIHAGRLLEDDVKAFISSKTVDGMQVLICGNTAFAGVMECYVRNCGVENVFIF